MSIREILEKEEYTRLDPAAAFSDQSKGRLRPEELEDTEVRTCYQRDTDRIVITVPV